MDSFKLFTKSLILLHSGFLFGLFLRRHSSRSPLRSSFRQRNSLENILRTEVAKSLNEFYACLYFFMKVSPCRAGLASDAPGCRWRAAGGMATVTIVLNKKQILPETDACLKENM